MSLINQQCFATKIYKIRQARIELYNLKRTAFWDGKGGNLLAIRMITKKIEDLENKKVEFDFNQFMRAIDEYDFLRMIDIASVGYNDAIVCAAKIIYNTRYCDVV